MELNFIEGTAHIACELLLLLLGISAPADFFGFKDTNIFLESDMVNYQQGWGF